MFDPAHVLTVSGLPCVGTHFAAVTERKDKTLPRGAELLQQSHTTRKAAPCVPHSTAQLSMQG